MEFNERASDRNCTVGGVMARGHMVPRHRRATSPQWEIPLMSKAMGEAMSEAIRWRNGLGWGAEAKRAHEG